MIKPLFICSKLFQEFFNKRFRNRLKFVALSYSLLLEEVNKWCKYAKRDLAREREWTFYPIGMLYLHRWGVQKRKRRQCKERGKGVRNFKISKLNSIVARKSSKWFCRNMQSMFLSLAIFYICTERKSIVNHSIWLDIFLSLCMCALRDVHMCSQLEWNISFWTFYLINFDLKRRKYTHTLHKFQYCRCLDRRLIFQTLDMSDSSSDCIYAYTCMCLVVCACALHSQHSTDLWIRFVFSTNSKSKQDLRRQKTVVSKKQITKIGKNTTHTHSIGSNDKWLELLLLKWDLLVVVGQIHAHCTTSNWVEFVWDDFVQMFRYKSCWKLHHSIGFNIFLSVHIIQ